MADFETPRLRNLARIREQQLQRASSKVLLNPKRRSIISSVGSNQEYEMTVSHCLDIRGYTVH